MKGMMGKKAKVMHEPKGGARTIKKSNGFKLDGAMGKCSCSKGTGDLTYGVGGVSSAKPGNRYSRGVKVPKGMGGGHGGGPFKTFPRRGR